MIGAQPSWNMIKGYKWGGDYHSRQEYYDQANHFKPGNYFESYLTAARDAGFKYAVLTTRHHDGYALWPSRYGIGVKQYLGGRDLVREYVDACHKTGMRVGFYFSPQDWHYPGYRPDTEWDVETWGKRGPVKDTVQNRKDFEKFFAYVIAQLEELLTNYGKIDVLWLDGMGWYGIPVSDLQTERVYAWIRSLQPDIVINDRWGNIVNPDNPAGTSMRIGDFTTPFECLTPTYVPSEWWEHCHIWTGKGGGWGYNTRGLFRPLSWFMEEFVASRSLGGNFLPNVGPSGSGDNSLAQGLDGHRRGIPYRLRTYPRSRVEQRASYDPGLSCRRKAAVFGYLVCPRAAPFQGAGQRQDGQGAIFGDASPHTRES